MATINATPNPVGVYPPSVKGLTSITWDTAPAPTRAKLFRSVNGSPPQELPNQGAGAVSRVTPIDEELTFPNTYTYILRSVPSVINPNPVDLASLVVDTYDIRQDLAESFSASYPQQIRPQSISNLSVRPGIDVVLVTFRTAKPTIPLVELRDDSGTKIDARFGLFGGLRTEHEAFFGDAEPLALETKHSIRIVAAGGAKEVEATAEFITGSRKAEIVFEEVDIFDDSDPGLRGEGEFHFVFGAGNAKTGESLGEPWPDFGWIGLDPDDDHVPIDRRITIPRAPRLLWVQTMAYESDGSAWPTEWWPSFRSVPDFLQPGTLFEYAEDHQEISVTEFVDIDHDVGAASTPFELSTGTFSINFVMKGHVSVESKFGQTLGTKSGKKRPRPKAVGQVSEAGMTAFVTPTGKVEDAQMFAFGPDNSLYHRAAQRPPTGLEVDWWTRVELPAEGRPAVVASAPGTIEMILHRDDGAVMHSRKSGKKQGAWRSLGDDFAQLLVAALPQKGGVAEAVLFGVTKEGTLLVRGTDREGPDWQRVSEGTAAIAVAEVPAGPVLLSIGVDRLLRFHTKAARWRGKALDLAVPGKDRLTALAVASVDRAASDKGSSELLIGVMSDQDRVRILRWPGFPGATPDARWEEAGSLQDLYNGPRLPAKAKARAAADPKTSKKRTEKRAVG